VVFQFVFGGEGFIFGRWRVAGGRLAEVKIRHSAIPRYARHGATPCHARVETIGKRGLFFTLAKNNPRAGIYSGATQNMAFSNFQEEICFSS
jgi:hypothetical protein